MVKFVTVVARLVCPDLCILQTLIPGPAQHLWMFPYFTQWSLFVFVLRVLGRMFVGGAVVTVLEEELTRVRRVDDRGDSGAVAEAFGGIHK